MKKVKKSIFGLMLNGPKVLLINGELREKDLEMWVMGEVIEAVEALEDLASHYRRDKAVHALSEVVDFVYLCKLIDRPVAIHDLFVFLNGNYEKLRDAHSMSVYSKANILSALRASAYLLDDKELVNETLQYWQFKNTLKGRPEHNIFDVRKALSVFHGMVNSFRKFIPS